MHITPPPPSHGPIPIPSFRRQERSDSTNPVDGKGRKMTVNSPLERPFQNNARHELDSRIVRMFYTVGFRLTLQGIHIIVVPIHMLLPITFRVMFLLDTMS